MFSTKNMLGVTVGLVLVSLVLVNGAGEGANGKKTPPPAQPTQKPNANAKPAAAPPTASTTTTSTTPPPPKTAPVVEKKKALTKLGPVKVKIGRLHDQRTGEWQELSTLGTKLSSPIDEIDGNYKLGIKVGTTNSPFHQVFLVLRHKESKNEVSYSIGITEENGDKTDYSLELDVTSINARDVNLKSGSYEIILYIGDFNLEKPVQWILGEVPIKLVQRAAKPINPLHAVSYEPKPEIKHMFREPEPRPPMVVSNAFTAFVLFPIVLLLGLWLKLGINVSNFSSCGLSAIVFHLGLIGMFGVYGLFWLKLTMFEAFKWMAIPGIITFLSGNRLLNHIAEQRTGK